MALAVLHSEAEWVARFGEPRRPAVLTVGNFDGVHLGHQKILGTVGALARQTNRVPALLTFYPHPSKVLRPSEAPRLLMTLDQRLDAIGETGIEAALVLRFDAEGSEYYACHGDCRRLFATPLSNARTILCQGY